MLNIGVVGYGYWGPNLVRNFAQTQGARVVSVCDPRPERRAAVTALYPAIIPTAAMAELLATDIDAVAIATPVSSHFDLALQALQAGKHVFLEKPFTATAAQAERLIEEAERRSLVLMVDHTFLYTGAVQKIHQLVHSGSLGQLYYYDSVRINLGLFQHDVNVLWDLAVHDLSIMDYVLGQQPVAVAATGVAHIPGQPENMAYLTCFFEQNLIAHFHVNWLAPLKVRRTLVSGSEKMIVYDDLEPSEKVKVYDKGVTLQNRPEDIYQMRVGYRTGDMHAPQVNLTEALQIEALHFAECVTQGARPLSDGLAGWRITRILEAADRSMQQRGQPIELK
ncbi:Gfo/Idh/MocA family oxidoreductase [Chloroflexia bacterium SDU3-3]|nr:Gfo/Idh/MocA family oxidoreductase [Chloroflexia bacterium SDU3-3]